MDRRGKALASANLGLCRQDNEEAAWQVILGIYDRVQMLRQFPELGHRYGKYPDKNIRILLYGHYRIRYQNVNVIRRHRSPQDHDVSRLTNLPNHIARTLGHSPT